jgi:hypothetical protein
MLSRTAAGLCLLVSLPTADSTDRLPGWRSRCLSSASSNPSIDQGLKEITKLGVI